MNESTPGTSSSSSDASANELPPHDETLRALYQQMPADEPPAHLDRAILDAAHREAKTVPRSTLSRWRVPAAVAAMMLVTLVIVREERVPDTLQRESVPQVLAESRNEAQPAAPAADVANQVAEPAAAPVASAVLKAREETSARALPERAQIAEDKQVLAKTNPAAEALNAPVAAASPASAAPVVAAAPPALSPALRAQEADAGALADNLVASGGGAGGALTAGSAGAGSISAAKGEAAAGADIILMGKARVAKKAATGAAGKIGKEQKDLGLSWPLGITPESTDACLRLKSLRPGDCVEQRVGDALIVRIRPEDAVFPARMDDALDAAGWQRDESVDLDAANRYMSRNGVAGAGAQVDVGYPDVDGWLVLRFAR